MNLVANFEEKPISEVEQLEQRIENLSPQELAKFRAWFVEFGARVWDDQIEAEPAPLPTTRQGRLTSFEALGLPALLALYEASPADVQALADKNFALLKSDPRHPSLHFNRIDNLWSVRVGDHYRALGTDVEDGIYWIWIGTHAEYDRIVS
jgi:hypothetical protein